MRKSFAVKKIASDRFQAVSFSLDATRPEEYFASLERDLGKLGVGGDVLLDLLACNGATSRRFVAVTFDGSHFDRRTMRIKSVAELRMDPAGTELVLAAMTPMLANLVVGVVAGAFALVLVVLAKKVLHRTAG